MIGRRRLLLTGLASVLAIQPLAAQLPKAMPHVGILNYAADDDIRVRQFRQALARLGHVDGKTLRLTLRSAGGSFDLLPQLASELVAAKVDCLIALGPAAWAAKKATSSVPTVIAFSGDMVEMGVVVSLAKPGGNITGFSYMSSDLTAKRLELLVSAYAKSQRVGVLYNPREPATKGELVAADVAARQLKVALVPIAAETPGSLDGAFAKAKAEQVDGLMVLTHGFAVLNGARIIELAARYHLPTLHGWRDFVTQGGLMSYGPDIEALVEGAARHVDKILKGASPAELPVEQPKRLLLTVNLKTAKALGLTIPPSILIRADEVIE